MPYLLNNKYQEVRELSETDFSDSNFKEMGRVEGNELKLGVAPFKTWNKDENKYDEETKCNGVTSRS